MTQPQKIASRFFFQTVALLLLYAITTLLGAVKFLSANDPLVYSLPYNQIGALGSILLNLAALTGLAGAGIYIASQQRLRSEKVLVYTGWLWTVLLMLAVLGGLIGFIEGRNGLELPPLLDLGFIVALVLLIGNVGMGMPVLQVWSIGLGISALGMIIGLIPAADYLQDRVFRALALGLSVNVGYPLAAVALGFWLMHRFSNITPAWADRGIFSVAGMITLAGALVTLGSFGTLSTSGWMQTAGSLAVLVVPVLYLIFAAHSYRALSDRNGTHTLTAHWFTLSLLLFLLGPGLLGALQAVSTINQWTTGTRLTDLQTNFSLLAIAAMGLAFINQAAAELRGRNWRVTGLVPFWLVSFGVLGGGLALGLAGVVQTFLERKLSVGYLDTQTLLVPLYTGWVVGIVLMLLGLAVYAFTLWLRRPHAGTT